MRNSENRVFQFRRSFGMFGMQQASKLDLVALYELFVDDTTKTECIRLMCERSETVTRLAVAVAVLLKKNDMLKGYVPAVQWSAPQEGKPLIRKLMFMKQYEAIGAMQKLRDDRAIGITKGVELVLQRKTEDCDSNGQCYLFRVESGAEHLDWQDTTSTPRTMEVVAPQELLLRRRKNLGSRVGFLYDEVHPGLLWNQRKQSFETRSIYVTLGFSIRAPRIIRARFTLAT